MSSADEYKFILTLNDIEYYIRLGGIKLEEWNLTDAKEEDVDDNFVSIFGYGYKKFYYKKKLINNKKLFNEWKQFIKTYVFNSKRGGSIILMDDNKLNEFLDRWKLLLNLNNKFEKEELEREEALKGSDAVISLFKKEEYKIVININGGEFYIKVKDADVLIEEWKLTDVKEEANENFICIYGYNKFYYKKKWDEKKLKQLNEVIIKLKGTNEDFLNCYLNHLDDEKFMQMLKYFTYWIRGEQEQLNDEKEKEEEDEKFKKEEYRIVINVKGINYYIDLINSGAFIEECDLTDAEEEANENFICIYGYNKFYYKKKWNEKKLKQLNEIIIKLKGNNYDFDCNLGNLSDEKFMYFLDYFKNWIKEEQIDEISEAELDDEIEGEEEYEIGVDVDVENFKEGQYKFVINVKGIEYYMYLWEGDDIIKKWNFTVFKEDINENFISIQGYNDYYCKKELNIFMLKDLIKVIKFYAYDNVGLIRLREEYTLDEFLNNLTDLFIVNSEHIEDEDEDDIDAIYEKIKKKKYKSKKEINKLHIIKKFETEKERLKFDMYYILSSNIYKQLIKDDIEQAIYYKALMENDPEKVDFVKKELKKKEYWEKQKQKNEYKKIEKKLSKAKEFIIEADNLLKIWMFKK